MANKNYIEILKKNAMLIVLVLVYIFFTVATGGGMFQAMNFNALITQNAYVFILATGMLMCMLTDHFPNSITCVHIKIRLLNFCMKSIREVCASVNALNIQ